MLQFWEGGITLVYAFEALSRSLGNAFQIAAVVGLLLQTQTMPEFDVNWRFGTLYLLTTRWVLVFSRSSARGNQLPLLAKKLANS